MIVWRLRAGGRLWTVDWVGRRVLSRGGRCDLLDLLSRVGVPTINKYPGNKLKANDPATGLDEIGRRMIGMTPMEGKRGGTKMLLTTELTPARYVLLYTV